MISVRIRRTGDAERILNRIRQGLAGPKTVKVGFPSGTGADIVMRAVWSEFGTAGGASGGGWGGPSPERPFFRNAMREGKPRYKRFLASEARKILAGRSEMRTALNRLGLVAVSDVQESITALSSPPNSPVTIARKGSSNPLIDTGEMRSRVVHKVEDR